MNNFKIVSMGELEPGDTFITTEWQKHENGIYKVWKKYEDNHDRTYSCCINLLSPRQEENFLNEIKVIRVAFLDIAVKRFKMPSTG